MHDPWFLASLPVDTGGDKLNEEKDKGEENEDFGDIKAADEEEEDNNNVIKDFWNKSDLNTMLFENWEVLYNK